MPPRQKTQFSPLPKTSPKKESDKTFDFYEALAHVAAGKSITKLEWKDESIFLKLVDGRLCIYKEDKLFHPLIVTDGDMIGLDWVVIEHK